MAAEQYRTILEIAGLIWMGYGVWFSVRGLGMLVWDRKDWWRPLSHRKRYPYPIAGVLLGVVFVLAGGRFALHYSWQGAPYLGYAVIGVFVLVVIAGVAQPRFLHPRWYGQLEDRLGKEAMRRLRAAAFKLDTEEWIEVDETEESFNAWVDRAVPHVPKPSRGYKKSE